MRRYAVMRSVALALPAIVVAGCASYDRVSTFGLGEGDAQVVHRTCSDIMGLTVSAEYQACGQSLATYVLALERAERPELPASSLRPAHLPAKHYVNMNTSEQRLRSELSCSQIGLLPEAADFDHCVSRLRHAIANVRDWPGP